MIQSLVVGVGIIGGLVVADTIAVKGTAVAPGVATADHECECSATMRNQDDGVPFWTARMQQLIEIESPRHMRAPVLFHSFDTLEAAVHKSPTAHGSRACWGQGSPGGAPRGGEVEGLGGVEESDGLADL